MHPLHAIICQLINLTIFLNRRKLSFRYSLIIICVANCILSLGSFLLSLLAETSKTRKKRLAKISFYTELSDIILEVTILNRHSVSLQIIQYSYITSNSGVKV